MDYYKNFSEEKFERYTKKVEQLYKIMNEYLKKFPLSFEPFMNVAHSKSIIDVKMSFKLDDTIETEENALFYVIEEGIHSIISKGLKNTESVHRFILSNHNYKNDSIEILKIINEFKEKIYPSQTEQIIRKPKYLLFGHKHVDCIEKIIEYINFDSPEPYYVGEYQDVKYYYVHKLDNIYLSNAPIVDLNNIRLLYNDTLNADLSDLENKNVKHKRIITLNAIIASKIDIIEIICSDDKNAFKAFEKKQK